MHRQFPSAIKQDPDLAYFRRVISSSTHPYALIENMKREQKIWKTYAKCDNSDLSLSNALKLRTTRTITQSLIFVNEYYNKNLPFEKRYDDEERQNAKNPQDPDYFVKLSSKIILLFSNMNTTPKTEPEQAIPIIRYYLLDKHHFQPLPPKSSTFMQIQPIPVLSSSALNTLSKT